MEDVILFLVPSFHAPVPGQICVVVVCLIYFLLYRKKGENGGAVMVIVMEQIY